MHVGIDGLAIGNRSGTGLYTEQLVVALAKRPDVEVTVWTGGHGWDRTKIPPGIRRSQVPGTGCALGRSAARRWLLGMAMHAQGIQVWHSPSSVPCRSGSVPQVLTLHDIACLEHPELFDRVRSCYWSRVMRQGASCARHILTDSHWSRERILAVLGLPAEAVSVVYPGVEEQFAPWPPDKCEHIRQMYDLPRKFVLCVGVIEPRKRVDQLLDACELLAARGLDVPLVLVGRSGWNCRRLLARLRNHTRVHLTGFIPRDDLPGLYSLATVACYPSCYEGFGLPVLEALACGCPTVTRANSAMSEVGGVAVTTFSEDTAESLSSALEEVLQGDPRQRALVRGRQKRAQQFTWEETAEHCVKVYQICMNKQSHQ